MRIKLLICGMIATALVAGCSDDGDGGPSAPEDPAPATANVTTATSPPPRFIPQSTRVRVGGTVTWENTSPSPVLHNVFWSSGGFGASPDFAMGETYEVTFPQAGTFDYQCSIHVGMTGRVTVE